MSGADENPAIPPRDYLGFKEGDKLLKAEEAHIAQRPGHDPDYISGLAISGGGIRSATFSIGVMQALARAGWMKIMDYLSTVSGGGYSGSSLTWFLHASPAHGKAASKPQRKEEDSEAIQTSRFGVSAENFPFGIGILHEDKEKERSRERRQIGVMRHLLQNINYLFPGHGINVLSFFAVLGRGILLNLIAYVPLGLVLFVLFAGFLSAVYGRPLAAENLNILNMWGGGVLGVLGIFGVLYGLLCWIGHLTESLLYRIRRWYAIIGGWALFIALVFFVIGSLPWVDQQFEKWLTTIGSLLTGGGFLGAIVSAIQAKKGKSKLSGNIVVGLASALLIYGLLLLYYAGTLYVFKRLDDSLTSQPVSLAQYGIEIASHWYWVAIPAGFSLLVGWFVNINYISLHRYYRDRLMELFMPNVGTTADCAAGKLPDEANRTYIQNVCDYQNGAEGPYHIINGNVVLVGSDITKFRGRGGDNFIFSPLYCGSSATGWAASHRFIGGKMTLPTAMAISGAAVNPNTGSAGRGATRNPLLSILMGLLNLRLGFWAQNPQSVLCCRRQGEQTVPSEGERGWWQRLLGCLGNLGRGSVYPPQHDDGMKRILWHIQCINGRPIPNLFLPGMRDLLRFRFRETSYMVQLTDGGHFENLAAYELIRRGLPFILIVDGAADGAFSFADFANLVERVRLDFSATIDIDLSPLVPEEKHAAHGIDRLAQRGFAVGTIAYNDGRKGILVYVKTTLIEGLPEDIYGYKLQHADFPDESTSDQIFDEQQFEAYRELGFQLGLRMTEAIESGKIDGHDILPGHGHLISDLHGRLDRARKQQRDEG